MTVHTVFLVEDHPVMREGYTSLIGFEPDLRVCGEASTSAEAFAAIQDARPSATLIDLSLPDGSGLELVKRLRSVGAGGALLVSSAHDEALYAERALRAGAHGYLMKLGSADHVVDALRTVIAGGLYVSDEVRARLFSTSPGGGLEGLTDRELEVFEQFGHGRTTREIADRLYLSPKTVESHRASIKRKLGVETQAEMLRHAVLWVQDSAA